MMGIQFRYNELVFIIVSLLFGTIELHKLGNLALGKKSYQSDVIRGAIADRAVDGNLSQIVVHYSTCAHPSERANVYWEVDLGSSYFNDHVTIYSRIDCCGSRLRDIELYIGKGRQNYKMHGFQKGILGSRFTFQLKQSVVGQWVRISRLPSVVAHLTLCEVQVFGFNAAQYYEINENIVCTEASIQATRGTKTAYHCAYVCYKSNGCKAANSRGEAEICELLTSNEKSFRRTMWISP